MIAIAGGFGAVSRYLLSRLIMVQTQSTFPIGTLVVNVVGCLLFGFFWGLADFRGVISERARIVALIGFLGAFTTFSSFAHETMVLIREERMAAAMFNVVAQNVAGLAAVMAGYQMSRWV